MISMSMYMLKIPARNDSPRNTYVVFSSNGAIRLYVACSADVIIVKPYKEEEKKLVRDKERKSANNILEIRNAASFLCSSPGSISYINMQKVAVLYECGQLAPWLT